MQSLRTSVESPPLESSPRFLRDCPGPGSNTSQRVHDHILTPAEATNFTLEKVFAGRPEWIDFTYEH